MSEGWFGERMKAGAVLAPIAGFSDAPFRRLARHFGAAWAVSEMVSAKAMSLRVQDRRGWRISAPYRGESPSVIQLFAGEPELAAAAVKQLEEEYHPDAFDLNLGCPVRKVINRGCGSDLLRDPERAAAVLAAMASNASVPVSAKLRLGVDRDVSVEVAQALVEAGAAALAVHGRTAAQRYAGRADWSAIARVAESVDVPVLGSGDVADREAYLHARAAGLGVMVARGAIGRPWLFALLRGADAPCRTAVAITLWRHARDHVAWHGGGAPLRGMRGALAAYACSLAQTDGAPLDRHALRATLVRVSTLAELRHALLAHARLDVKSISDDAGEAWQALAHTPTLARNGDG